MGLLITGKAFEAIKIHVIKELDEIGQTCLFIYHICRTKTEKSNQTKLQSLHNGVHKYFNRVKCVFQNVFWNNESIILFFNKFLSALPVRSLALLKLLLTDFNHIFL